MRENNIPVLHGEDKGSHWLRCIGIRHERNEQWAADAVTDISYSTENPLWGDRKIQIPADTINAVYAHLQKRNDFALKSIEGGMVYFIDQKIMVSWNENDHSNDTITALPNKRKLEEALKITLLGHQIFVSFDEFKNDNAYKTLAKGYYGEPKPLVMLLP